VLRFRVMLSGYIDTIDAEISRLQQVRRLLADTPVAVSKLNGTTSMAVGGRKRKKMSQLLARRLVRPKRSVGQKQNLQGRHKPVYERQIVDFNSFLAPASGAHYH